MAELPTHDAAHGLAAAHERAERLVRVGYAIAAVTVLLQSAAHVVGVRAFDDEVSSLNADVEANMLAWAGAAAAFAAAVASFVLALVRERVDRRLLLLALLLAAFSLDEALRLHERTGAAGADAAGASEDVGRMASLALYVPLLAVALYGLVEATRRGFDPAARAIRFGVALLAGAIAADIAAAVSTVVLDVERGSWPDVIEVAVEEGAELGGWLLVAFGLTAALLVRAAEEGRA